MPRINSRPNYNYRPAAMTIAFCAAQMVFMPSAQSQNAGAAPTPTPAPPKAKGTPRLWEPTAFRGPIPTRNMDPLGELFLMPVPTGGGVLEKKAVRMEVTIDVANNFVDQRRPATQQIPPRSFVTDFEEQRLTVGYARGLGSRQEVSVRVPLVARNKGLLDKVIRDFDDLLNAEGNSRGNTPDNRNLYQVTDGAGNTLVNSTSSEIGLGDTTLEYRYGLTRKAVSEQKRPLQVALRGLVKLPTASASKAFGSGNFDLGIGVAATWQPSKRWALHGNATEVFIGNPDNNAFVTRSKALHTFVAAEYQLKPKTSLVIQSDQNELPIRNAFVTSKPRKALTMGFWHTASERKSYFFSFSENKIRPFGGSGVGSSPDFALALGLRFSR